jgi:pyruvate/2-oxoacid:ferredoxin oxidoreductase beta subunit
MNCKQCRQPLEEWEAGFCEGCGSKFFKRQARKAAHGVLTMIEIAFTAVDVFGCFGPADAVYTTLFCPTGTQVCGALYRAECGHALDASDQTIVDLCLAGF